MERKTVEILHGLSKIGVYDEAHEVPAFTILVKSYMAEVDQTVIKNKAQLERNLKALDKSRKLGLSLRAFHLTVICFKE